MPDAKQPTQKEIDDTAAKLKEAEAKLKELEVEVKKLSKSNDRRTVLEIIARKISVFGPYTTGVGFLGLSVEKLDELKQEFEDNLDILIEYLEKIADFLIALVKGIIEVFEALTKKIVSIFEKQKGEGVLEQTALKGVRVNGATNNLRFEFSELLQASGLPASFGPMEGSWQAELAYHGTDAEENQLYRVTSFLSETPALIVGPAQLEGIQQVINADRRSIITYKKSDGTFSGKVYTRFLSATWGEDDVLGIPCTTRVTGKVANNNFTYNSEGEEIVWASYLVPGLATP